MRDNSKKPLLALDVYQLVTHLMSNHPPHHPRPPKPYKKTLHFVLFDIVKKIAFRRMTFTHLIQLYTFNAQLAQSEH
jgi:hypothetical protein